MKEYIVTVDIDHCGYTMEIDILPIDKSRGF